MPSAFLVLIATAGDDAITTFRLDGDTLTPLAVNSGLTGTGTFAIDTDRDLVYAGVKGSPAGIVTLSLDRTSGVLTPLARRDVPASMAYVWLTPDGARLLGASYGGGQGFVWPIERDGRLSDPVAEVQHRNLHAVVTAGRHAYFVSLGEDLIAQFELAPGGQLAPLDPPTVDAPAGSGPRHVVVSPEGRNLYVLTEFSGEVLRYERDATSGVLTLRERVSAVDPDAGLGHSVFGADPREHHYIWGADVHLTPDARALVCSERTASTLATIGLDDRGRLERQLAVTPAETQPRGFALTPDGRHAIVVGERSTEVALHRLNDDGTLPLLTRTPNGRGANWVRVIPLG